MNLKSAVEAYKAKRIHVFENGLECSFGSSMVINPTWGRTWNKILTYISQVIKPAYGPVRHLKSIDGKGSIHSFTDLINGERYVACGKENFKNVLSGYHTEPEYKRLKKKKCSQHYNKVNMKEGNNKDKYWDLLQAQKNKRTVIHVFSNGIKHQAAVKFVLVEGDLYNWQRLLGHMSNMMDKPEGITSLFTIFGQRICGPCAVQHGAYYVAVAFGEQFEKLDYVKGQKEYLLTRKKHTDLMEQFTINAIGSPTHIVANNDDHYFKKYLDLSRKSKSGPLIFDTQNIKPKTNQKIPRRIEMDSKKDHGHYAKTESLLHAEEQFLNELRKELEETTASEQNTKAVQVKNVGKDRKRSKLVDVQSDTSVSSSITQYCTTSKNQTPSSLNEQPDNRSLCSNTTQTSEISKTGKDVFKNKTSEPNKITIDSKDHQLTTVCSHGNDIIGKTSQKQTGCKHKRRTLKSNKTQSSISSKSSMIQRTVSNITITEIKKPVTSDGLSLVSNIIPSITSMNTEIGTESLKYGGRLSLIAHILNDLIKEFERKNSITKSTTNNGSVSSDEDKIILGKKLSDVNADSNALETLNTSKVLEPAISDEVKVEETGFKIVINKTVNTSDQVTQTEPVLDCETETNVFDNDPQTSEVQIQDDSSMPSDMVSYQNQSSVSMLGNINSTENSNDSEINERKMIAIASVAEIIRGSFGPLDKEHSSPKRSIIQRRSTGFNFNFKYPVNKIVDNEDETDEESQQSKPSDISGSEVSSVSGCCGVGFLDQEVTRSQLSKLSSVKSDKSEEEGNHIETQHNSITQDIFLNQDNTFCNCKTNMGTSKKCTCEGIDLQCSYGPNDLNIFSQNINTEDKTETHLQNRQADERGITTKDEEKLIAIDNGSPCRCDSKEVTTTQKGPCQCESNHDQNMSCSAVCSHQNKSTDVNVFYKSNSLLQSPSKEYGTSRCITFFKKIFNCNP